MYSIRLLLLLYIILLSGCSEETVSPEWEPIIPENPVVAGDRKFGINISESQAGFNNDFQIVQQAGVQVVELNIPWNTIEVNEGEYQDPFGLLAASSFYGTNGLEVNFSIAVINTVQWEVPSYLEGVSPDESEFIDAFNNMIDWFIAEIPENVTIGAISIGNEVNLVLETAIDWSAYTTFYQNAASHVHTNYPEVNVGVKTTVFGGLLDGERQEIEAINEYSDIIMLNYYPLNNQMQVFETDRVITDFNIIADTFQGKEVWITEIGYPSGEQYNQSSQEKQARFYYDMFQAWDQHNEQFTHLTVNWLHDQSPQQIEQWKSYYGNDPALVEFLSTLGIRNYDGTPKYAWEQILVETEGRGW